jgi:hypothetical protein
MIPESPAQETASSAERRFFEHLRDDTPEALVAFHHVAWLAPGKHGRPQEGEADFVVADAERGVLVIEVKGGGVRYDAVAGRWSSVGNEGTFEIKDPFEQARRGAHRLRDLLGRTRRGGAERFRVGHAVAFPDTRVDVQRLGPATPREIVFDGNDLHDLATKLDAIFRYWSGRDPGPKPGPDGVGLLERVLANSFELRAPLAIELVEEDRELMRLTEAQYRILDLLARHPRAAISGCAGSGKTFLAAEKARRLAAQGFRVLVLCFNQLLGEHLRRGLADVEVEALTFDELCLRVVREAGIEVPEQPEAGDKGPYFNALRRRFSEAVEVAAGRYGALVVDERPGLRRRLVAPAPASPRG